MQVRKTVKRVLWAALFCLLAAGGILYWQASREPEGYQPELMTHEQSDAAANDFISRKIIDEFGNKSQENQPFDWTLTQQQANQALASMDEISFQLGGKPGQVKREMDKLGLSQPAVRFLDDRVVLMVHSRRFDKILSAEMSFASLSDGRLKVKLERVRVGCLCVPQSFIDRQLASLETALIPHEQTQGPASSGLGLVHAKDLGKALGEVFGAVRGQPIRPELKWPVNRKKVLVQSVDFSDGQMTLHMQPVSKPPATRIVAGGLEQESSRK